MRSAAAPVCTACPLTEIVGAEPTCVLMRSEPLTRGTALPPMLISDYAAATRLPSVIFGEASVWVSAATTS